MPNRIAERKGSQPWGAFGWPQQKRDHDSWVEKNLQRFNGGGHAGAILEKESLPAYSGFKRRPINRK